MKQLISFLLLLLLVSCAKDRLNPEPKVETVSVTSPEEGIIEMTGRIIDEGADPVVYTGFCLSTDPEPDMMDTQILLGEPNGDFKANISYSIAGEDIYVRTFAANEIGFSYGNIIKFTAPSFNPPTVPCTLAENTINDQGFSYTVSHADSGKIYQTFGSFALNIRTQGSGPTILIEFNSHPRNGTYITATDYRFRAGYINEVRLVIHDSNFYNAVEGQNIYVTNLPNGNLKFDFCGIRYFINQFELKISGSVILD